MGRFIDITGNKYGKLTVIERVESDKGRGAKWLCKCDCGNEKDILGSDLRRGGTISCRKCSVNKWEFKEDYVVGYTKKGEKFYIDLEDYEEVSKYSWCMDSEGYFVSSTIKGKTIKLHRFIMKAKKGEIVDHINQDLFDNRKSKMRICTNQENQMNRRNVKGYSWNKRMEKFKAGIMLNGKEIHLGYYSKEDEARLAYCTKALELFGEFAHESVREDYERLSKKLNKINK